MYSQISSDHKDKITEKNQELVTLVVTQVGGLGYKVSGVVGADGRSVLIGINDLVFSQGADLKGSLLVYKSSNPQDLGNIVGRCTIVADFFRIP